jgi:hypothetical protein
VSGLIARSFDEFKSNPECIAVWLRTHFPSTVPGVPGRVGHLLIIKPKLTESAPHDVRQYKDEQPSFPHETTENQFFDDVQWESHRALGYAQASALLQ